MTEVDWKRTLKEIEREYDGLPPAPSPGALKAKKAAEEAAREAAKRFRSRVAVLLRLVPVLALSAGLAWWPYAAGCGFGLGGFLGAIAATTLGGIWVAVSTWRARMPAVHVVALLVIAWGVVMAAREVLPREGYARPDAARATWRCGK